jgi:hypothetical protein
MAAPDRSPARLRQLLSEARCAYAQYLRFRYELRALGVTEATLAGLEAGEHHTHDLTIQQHLDAHGLDVSGNCITGP